MHDHRSRIERNLSMYRRLHENGAARPGHFNSLSQAIRGTRGFDHPVIGGNRKPRSHDFRVDTRLLRNAQFCLMTSELMNAMPRGAENLGYKQTQLAVAENCDFNRSIKAGLIQNFTRG